MPRVLRQMTPATRRVRRPSALATMATGAFALACTFALGCSAPPIERLHGEPKAADRYTTPRPADPPVADAVNRFIAAVRRGAVEEAYEGLSRATRMALEVRARTVGLSGVDLLRPAGKQASAAARKLFVRDPIAQFTLAKLKTIRVGERPWPPNKPHEGRTLLWAVELVDQTGRSRVITLRFEGILWRIHNPKLSAPKG